MIERWTPFLFLLCLLAGCRGQVSERAPIHLNPNMDDQERYDPQEVNTFFADGRSARMPVAGVVARGHLKDDSAFYRGKTSNDTYIEYNPLPIDEKLLRRGRERYNVFCATCHDRSGYGKGLAATYPARGFIPLPSFHEERFLKDYPDGQIYEVITQGVRTMPAYALQIADYDRWAIVAYRALQRSQNADLRDIPLNIRESMESR